ncbi:hypothetical protein [Lewinella sp. W8]|uniref:HU domain-containing protein n=1 Tax=Lewinella sp. W8 TaxID=2528208 RepID=UPI0010686183|nr:hypothetical protein [Lewinella sp. W8]MTB50215.1 hypothetical protein [Lewinella sp. W8]
MTEQIVTAIRELLMEEGKVGLPGLGTLQLAPQPALISPVEGKALPPSERVTFNENLVLDDGKILQYLISTTEIDPQVLEKELKLFLASTSEALDAGRSFTIEGVGRLFKHYDGQMRFTASGDNYSKDSFGLPEIALQPVVRTEKRRSSTADDPMLVTGTAAGQSTPKSNLLQDPALRQILWYVAAVLGVILLAVILWRLAQTIAGTSEEDPLEPQATEIPDDRLNVPPPATSVRPTPPPVDADRVRPDDPPRLNQPPTRPEEPSGEVPSSTEEPAPVTPPRTPSTTPSPGSPNVAIIATGLYGQDRNVEKNLRRIKEAGYEAYSRPEGRLTRVGIRLSYDTEEELFEALNVIRSRFTSDAFVTEINGEEVSIR